MQITRAALNNLTFEESMKTLFNYKEAILNYYTGGIIVANTNKIPLYNMKMAGLSAPLKFTLVVFVVTS